MAEIRERDNEKQMQMELRYNANMVITSLICFQFSLSAYHTNINMFKTNYNELVVYTLLLLILL